MSSGANVTQLNPGDRHYRAYVGPPGRYDLISGLSFTLLTAFLGLRQHHRVLDIGCGSLRNGRLLIPYLDPGCYVGLEPERWLVEEGIAHECGEAQIAIKRPSFIYADDWPVASAGVVFDYLLAQSIFSHAAQSQIVQCLRNCAPSMRDHSVLAATFVLGDVDYGGDGWVYPANVAYRPGTIDAMIAAAGLSGVRTDYVHPKQTWYLLGKDCAVLERLRQRIDACAPHLFAEALELSGRSSTAASAPY